MCHSLAAGILATARDEPDLVLTSSARTVIAARRGDTTLDEAIAAGAIERRGSTRALGHFQRVFRLP